MSIRSFVSVFVPRGAPDEPIIEQRFIQLVTPRPIDRLFNDTFCITHPHLRDYEHYLNGLELIARDFQDQFFYLAYAPVAGVIPEWHRQ